MTGVTKFKPFVSSPIIARPASLAESEREIISADEPNDFDELSAWLRDWNSNNGDVIEEMPDLSAFDAIDNPAS